MEKFRKPRKIRKFSDREERALADKAILISKIIVKTISPNLDEFPWRRSNNPWHIILAEVLLQRVTAERVVEVYEKLLKLAPTPEEFLKVPEDQVKVVIKPLGLQNKKYDLLKELAMKISNEEIKNQPKIMEKIKGLGKFGKAVFEVFVFGKNSPLLDEVVGRVFARALGLELRGKAVNDKRLLTIMKSVANSLALADLKTLFYSSVDLGRKICKVRNPACNSCCIVRLCKYASKTRQHSY